MNKKETWLKATVNSFFRPGSGTAWEKSESFTKDEILNPEKNTFGNSFFEITLTEKTPVSLKGRISLGNVYGGTFSIDMEHPVHETGYVNVNYDTHFNLMLQMFEE